MDGVSWRCVCVMCDVTRYVQIHTHCNFFTDAPPHEHFCSKYCLCFDSHLHLREM